MQTRLFLGVAAITALAGGQAFANGDDRPVVTGYFGAGYFHTEADFDFDDDIIIGDDIIFDDIFDEDFDDDGWGAEGAAAFTLAQDIGLQVSGVVRDTRSTDTSWSIDAHANYRDDRMLLGGFLGGGEFSNHGTTVFVSDLADIDFGALDPFLDDDDDSFWTIGAEGEYYWPSWTLAAAVSYADFDDDDDDDAWSIDGEARWFLTPDLRLEGELGWASFNNGFGNFVVVDDTGTIFVFENDDDDDNVWSVGVSGEWQFGGGPLSVYAAYEHDEFDSSDFSTDVFSIGARINFGELTLRERDQTGVSLPGLSRFTAALGD
jgi:hypothetical protein